MSIIRKEQLSNPLSASYAATASIATSASFATTASYAENTNITFNTSSLVTTSSFNAYTASINSFTSSINTFTASYNTGSFTGSFTGNIIGTSSWAVSASQAISASYYRETDPVFTAISGTFVTTSSFNSFTSSINTFTSSYNTGSFTGSFTGSLQGTASWATNALLAVSASNYQETDPVFVAKSASLATTGSNTFIGNQTITGSLVVTSNFTVLGSASIQYISESTLNISTNLITVNTNNPSVRFGGLAVIDSGSSPLTSASFLYDAVQDEFIFVHRGDGVNITSSHFVLGPETYNDQGNEIYLTANRIPKGKGNEHLNDSNISDNGSLVNINSNTTVSGSLTVTGSLFVSNSINSDSRALLDTTGQKSVDWSGRILNDTNNTPSIEWESRYLYDTSEVLSIDWENRILYDLSGNEVLGWSDPSTATFYGTASYAQLAQSASLVLVDRETVNGRAYLIYTDQIDSSGVYAALYNNSSVYLTGSTFVVPRIESSFTGSLLGTASYATQALSASFATTASYINPTFISASAAASGFGSGGSVDTGSFLITASVIRNTITFTKGDGSTFPITVNTGSGGGGGSITVQDQGSSLGTATVFNFTGSGVTSSLSSNTASIQINSSFDLMTLYNLSPAALLSAANFLSPFPGLATLGNENTVRTCYLDRIVGVRGFAVRTATAQSGLGSLVVTVRKGANPAAMADTSIVLTIAAGSAAGAYAGNFNENIGEGYIAYRVNNNANATGATIGSVHLWGI